MAKMMRSVSKSVKQVRGRRLGGARRRRRDTGIGRTISRMSDRLHRLLQFAGEGATSVSDGRDRVASKRLRISKIRVKKPG